MATELTVDLAPMVSFVDNMRSELWVSPPAGTSSARGSVAKTLIVRWLAIWLASRVMVALTIMATALIRDVESAERRASLPQWILYRFAHFDSHLYGAVAERGYVESGPASHYNAFFPGLPLVLRLWQDAFGSDGRWGGLLAVVIAGCVAAVALGWLATDVTGRSSAGTWAVILLSVSPLTVFFSVVYTEALFMAACTAAWLAARRGRWALAGLLGLAACTLRFNGTFLIAGLIVLALARRNHDLSPVYSRLLWLTPGPFFVLFWLLWLRDLTGAWNAWGAAQQAGWGRSLAAPWDAVAVGFSNVAEAGSWHLLASRLMDLGALGAAVAATVYFVVRKDWPVAVLISLNAVTVLCSTVIYSGPRFLLVWFPIYVALASFVDRRPLRSTVPWLVGSTALSLLFAFYWGAQWWIA